MMGKLTGLTDKAKFRKERPPLVDKKTLRTLKKKTVISAKYFRENVGDTDIKPAEVRKMQPEMRRQNW